MGFREKFSVTNVLIADITFHLSEDLRDYPKSFLMSIFWESRRSNNFHSNMTAVSLGLKSNLIRLNLKQDK
jgi:hypothetical protein